MNELFFVLSCVMAVGLVGYAAVLFVLNRDTREGNYEKDQIKDMLDTIRGENIGAKVLFIFLLGGTFLSEIAVGIINFPFQIYDNMREKKSA